MTRIAEWTQKFLRLDKYNCPVCGGEMIHTPTDKGNIWVCENDDWATSITYEKLKWHNRVWLSLNNNKTWIGGLTVATGWIMTMIVPPVGEAMKWTGYSILGVGVGHKVVKAVGKIKVKKETGERVWWIDLITFLLEQISKLIKRR